MTRKFLYLTAAAALLAMGACTGKTATTATADTSDKSDVVYTGVLPSADADGVRYTLLLDYDDDANGGDYEMVQTYFATDSTGVCDIASFATEGDFTVQNQDGRKGLRLSGDGAGEMYFLVNSDSTIVMTNSSYAPADTPGMNYTLKAAK